MISEGDNSKKGSGKTHLKLDSSTRLPPCRSLALLSSYLTLQRLHFPPQRPHLFPLNLLFRFKGLPRSPRRAVEHLQGFLRLLSGLTSLCVCKSDAEGVKTGGGR
jgi:hypothetical protein